MSFGIERFCEQLGDAIAADLTAKFELIERKADSSIERLFWLYFLTAAQSHPSLGGLNVSGYVDEASLSGPADIFLGRQITVLDWPVDFVIVARLGYKEDRPISRLAIECDGHDFHERTKEQAARDRSRDRALQAAGYTVMRFTGSELYRDPMKCMEEVLRWCAKNAWGTEL